MALALTGWIQKCDATNPNSVKQESWSDVLLVEQKDFQWRWFESTD